MLVTMILFDVFLCVWSVEWPPDRPFVGKYGSLRGGMVVEEGKHEWFGMKCHPIWGGWWVPGGVVAEKR